MANWFSNNLIVKKRDDKDNKLEKGLKKYNSIKELLRNNDIDVYYELDDYEMEISEDNGYKNITYETRNAPSTELIITLSKLFPDYTFYLFVQNVNDDDFKEEVMFKFQNGEELQGE